MRCVRRAQRRTLENDEVALSNVLGAIMVFGLLVITLVTIQVRFVPVWDEEREARHVDTVIDQLSLFKADIERLSTNATGGTLADPLTLKPEGGFKFFQGATVGGAASFEPAGAEGVTLESPQLRITQRDGQPLYALGEVWTAIPAADGLVEDLTDVDHLRVRIVEPNDENNLDKATLTVLDAEGDYAGKVIITFLRDASERSIQTEIFSASSSTEPITVQRESYFHQVDPPYVYVNLLDDELLFGQVLAAASSPFDIDFVSDDLNADYTVAFTTITGGSAGSEGGLVVPDFSTSLASGALVFDTNNQRLPAQTFIVEHGAILVVQSDGAAMLVPPTLAVSATEDQVVLDWVVPGLDGAATGISGVRAGSLRASAAGSPTQIEAVAAQVTFTLPTRNPAVWSAFLEDRMEQAGLTDQGALPQFSVASTASNVTLTVFGPASDPSDADEDVFLRYQQARIAVELRPTG